MFIFIAIVCTSYCLIISYLHGFITNIQPKLPPRNPEILLFKPTKDSFGKWQRLAKKIARKISFLKKNTEIWGSLGRLAC